MIAKFQKSIIPSLKKLFHNSKNKSINLPKFQNSKFHEMFFKIRSAWSTFVYQWWTNMLILVSTTKPCYFNVDFRNFFFQTLIRESDVLPRIIVSKTSLFADKKGVDFR